MNSLLTHTAATRDPTRTIVLRAKYAANMRSRWAKVRKQTRSGLQNGDFTSRLAFMNWMRGAMDEHVLVDDGQWQRDYLSAGYRRGVKQADTDVKAANLTLPKEGLARRQLLEGIHAGEISDSTRRYSADLQHITDVVWEQVDQVAFDTWGTDDLIPRVENRINKIGRTRGTVLAVTAIIDVFALGTLNRLDALGFRRVAIIPEVILTTAGDARVCPDCNYLSTQEFDVFSARGVIPVHGRCRCRWTLDLGFLLGQLAAIKLLDDRRN